MPRLSDRLGIRVSAGLAAGRPGFGVGVQRWQAWAVTVAFGACVLTSLQSGRFGRTYQYWDSRIWALSGFLYVFCRCCISPASFDGQLSGRGLGAAHAVGLVADRCSRIATNRRRECQ